MSLSIPKGLYFAMRIIAIFSSLFLSWLVSSCTTTIPVSPSAEAAQQAAALVRGGDLFFKNRLPDDARIAYEQALAKVPTQLDAIRGLRRLEQMRRVPPKPVPEIRTVPVHREYSTAEKMRVIVVPKIDFDDTPVWVVCDWLTQRSKDLDPEGKGISFHMALPPHDMIVQGRIIHYDSSAQLRTLVVSIDLTNVSLDDVMLQICMKTGCLPSYGDGSVNIAYPDNWRLDSVETWVFPVIPAVMDNVCKGEPGGWNAVAKTSDNLQKFFIRRGINFMPGYYAAYDPVINKLIVRSAPDNLWRIKRLLAMAYWELSDQGRTPVRLPECETVATRVGAAFAAEITELEKEYPELAGFGARKRDVSRMSAIRFVKVAIQDGDAQKAVTPEGLMAGGIDLHFSFSRDTRIGGEPGYGQTLELRGLGVTLHSGFVLSGHSPPGLQKKLTAIFAKYRAFLQELDGLTGR